MNALDARLPALDDDRRFAQAVLGLLAHCQRVSSLAAVPRADGGRAAPGPLTDFFLGIVSLERTLRAVLACDAAAAPSAGREPAADAAGAAPLPPGLLR